MSNTLSTDYAHVRPTRHERLSLCQVCNLCHNMNCLIKQQLPLYAGIDCGALFRVLDQEGFRCERQLVPAKEA